jgi:hypothetical protein
LGVEGIERKQPAQPVARREFRAGADEDAAFQFSICKPRSAVAARGLVEVFDPFDLFILRAQYRACGVLTKGVAH